MTWLGCVKQAHGCNGIGLAASKTFASPVRNASSAHQYLQAVFIAPGQVLEQRQQALARLGQQ